MDTLSKGYRILLNDFFEQIWCSEGTILEPKDDRPIKLPDPREELWNKEVAEGLKKLEEEEAKERKDR